MTKKEIANELVKQQQIINGLVSEKKALQDNICNRDLKHSKRFEPRSGFMAHVKKTSKLISEDIVKKIIVSNIINNVVNNASINLKYSPFLKSNPVI